MKVLKTRWKLVVLVPLVAIAILSIGNRIGAAPDQTKQVREAANEVGIIIEGGITQGQVFRFNVTRLATIQPGPPNSNPHAGDWNLELRVFDSQGNILATNTYVFPQNQNNTPIQSSFFALSADQLPASAFDNTGRAQLTGIVKSIDPNNPNKPPNPTCGFVASGEIFNNNTAGTLVHIAGVPLSSCH
jgi:hypothetical protein